MFRRSLRLQINKPQTPFTAVCNVQENKNKKCDIIVSMKPKERYTSHTSENVVHSHD